MLFTKKVYLQHKFVFTWQEHWCEKGGRKAAYKLCTVMTNLKILITESKQMTQQVWVFSIWKKRKGCIIRVHQKYHPYCTCYVRHSQMLQSPPHLYPQHTSTECVGLVLSDDSSHVSGMPVTPCDGFLHSQLIHLRLWCQSSFLKLLYSSK